MRLPPLYPVVDVSTLQRRDVDLRTFVQSLVDAGAGVLQLRDKDGSPQEILRRAELISGVIAGSSCLPIMNDRADLALLAGWRAVHVGHRDLPPEAVRGVLGGADAIVGVSTHSDLQVVAADEGTPDYVAIGPVFATGTKSDAEPVVGLEGVRRARRLTTKPLVAIGGITRDNAEAVMEAGADSVAVIGGLFAAGESTKDIVEDFLRRLR